MSQSWPPEQRWPPRQGQPQSPSGAPNSDYPDSGYDSPGAGYGQPDAGYSYQQPGQSWQQPQQSGWPPAEDGAWPQGSTSRPLYPQYPPSQQYPPYPQQPQYSQYPQYQPHQQYPQYQQDQYGAPYGPQQQYDRPRRSLGGLVTVVLVAMILLVAGGGVYMLVQNHAHTSTPPGVRVTTAATATPGIPQGFKAYSDDAAHIRFAIPQGWTTTGSPSGSTGLQVMSSDQNNLILVKQFNFAGSSSSDVGAANGALAGAAGSGGVTNKQGPTNVQFAGETWVQVSGDESPNGTHIHMVILVSTHKGSTYLIGFASVISAFDSANSHYFQPMRNSFTFTN